MKRLSIIYDGQCAFCTRSIQLLKRVDSFQVFEFYDCHDEETMRNKFPLVKPEDAAEAMLTVTESGDMYKGFYAFRRLVWKSPWLWLAAPLFYFPGSSFFGTRLYACVARNRGRFGCRAESGEDSDVSLAPGSPKNKFPRQG